MSDEAAREWVLRKGFWDHLGRGSPKVAFTPEGLASFMEASSLPGVIDLLNLVAGGPARPAVVAAALRAGHTHYPPDLAGRRSRIR